MTTTRDRSKQRGEKKNGADVIHVAFGPGGGRLSHPHDASKKSVSPTAAGPNASADSLDGANRHEPITDVFTLREVAKLLAVPEGKLRSLDRASIVSPSGVRGK